MEISGAGEETIKSRIGEEGCARKTEYKVQFMCMCLYSLVVSLATQKHKGPNTTSAFYGTGHDHIIKTEYS